jgi:hypothetical protein
MWFTVLEKRHGGTNLRYHGRINVSEQQGLPVFAVSQDLAERIDNGRAPEKSEIATFPNPIHSHHKTLTLNGAGSEQ